MEPIIKHLLQRRFHHSLTVFFFCLPPFLSATISGDMVSPEVPSFLNIRWQATTARTWGFRMSKTALNQHSVTMAREMEKAGDKVAVVALYPGHLATRMTNYSCSNDMGWKYQQSGWCDWVDWSGVDWDLCELEGRGFAVVVMMMMMMMMMKIWKTQGSCIPPHIHTPSLSLFFSTAPALARLGHYARSSISQDETVHGVGSDYYNLGDAGIDLFLTTDEHVNF
jgi:hypothetical protein